MAVLAEAAEPRPLSMAGTLVAVTTARLLSDDLIGFKPETGHVFLLLSVNDHCILISDVLTAQVFFC